MSLKELRKSVAFGVLAMLALGSAGCGYDGVELNGKIFDAMGVNGSASREEVKLKRRTDLVIPPATASLPEPGKEPPPQADLAEIQDHDRSKQVNQEELMRRQKEFCDKNYKQAIARGDDTAYSVKGPAGPCHASIFSAISDWNKSDEPQEGQ